MGLDRILSFLIGAAVLLVVFLIAEHRQARPMLDLTLFRRPAFAGASIVAFAVSASMFSMFLYLTLYIQDVLGYDPLQAGLRFLPITLMTFVVAPFSGKLSVRVPVRLLLGVGMLRVSGGLLSMTAVDASSGWTTLIPGFLLQASASAPSTRRSPRPRSGSCTTRAAAWPRASTTPSARSASPPASPGSAPSSSTRSPAGTTGALVATAPGREVVASAHDRLGGALVSGEVSQLARHLPPPRVTRSATPTASASPTRSPRS